jgi:hypothetical protein
VLIPAQPEAVTSDLPMAMNLKIGPERKLQEVKATGPPVIQQHLDSSISARTLPSQRRPDKASIQGLAGTVSSGAMPIVWNIERRPNQADKNSSGFQSSRVSSRACEVGEGPLTG